MNKCTIGNLGSSLLYILIGVVLLIAAEAALKPICYIIALATAVFGLVEVIGYIRRPVEENVNSNGFTIGVVMLIVSVAIIFASETLIPVITFIMALMISLNGVHELQNSVDAQRLKVPRAWFTTLVAILHILLGILLMANPFTSETIFYLVLGVGLIASGLADFIVNALLSVRMRRLSVGGSQVDAFEDEQTSTEIKEDNSL